MKVYRFTPPHVMRSHIVHFHRSRVTSTIERAARHSVILAGSLLYSSDNICQLGTDLEITNKS